MGLPETISKVLQTVEKLKIGTAGNEANTRALLIEPMLDALGWNPTDLDAVEREVKVFEGTFLDYALKVDAEARLYVEAKGISGNLDDKKFVAQTINYANNDGVLWCVLTNGLRYRVYKTNEPVAMDQKLLFEVDLSEKPESLSEKAKLLRLISREAVEAGDLDRFGDRVFTDTRVRKALAELAADPPQPLLDAVTSKLGQPAVPLDALRRSLARILDASVAPDATAPPPHVHPPKMQPVGPSGPPKAQEYPLDHHFGNKSSLIRELFEELDNYATALGPDVSRRVRKFYVGYFRGKRCFFTVEAQLRRLIVYLSLDPTSTSTKPWNPETMRDVSKVGHYGMGDTEYSLRTVDQLEEVRALIKMAYESASS